MNWELTIVTYGATYLFLSLCVALVVGRLLRVMAQPFAPEDAALDDPTLDDVADSPWMSHREWEPAELVAT